MILFSPTDTEPTQASASARASTQERIQGHSQQDDDPLHDVLDRLGPVSKVQAVAYAGHDERSKQRRPHSSLATEEAGAADDRSANCLEEQRPAPGQCPGQAL